MTSDTEEYMKEAAAAARPLPDEPLEKPGYTTELVGDKFVTYKKTLKLTSEQIVSGFSSYVYLDTDLY